MNFGSIDHLSLNDSFWTIFWQIRGRYLELVTKGATQTGTSTYEVPLALKIEIEKPDE